jgi:peptidoglycan pentaglycine glycine transferase (the first glycine)
VITARVVTDRAAWNSAVATLPGAHVLQTWEWGEFKQVTTGWAPHRLLWERDGAPAAAASIGMRSAGPLKLMYAPKGPALDHADLPLLARVLDDMQAFARSRLAVWLKIDPDVIAGTGIPGEPDAHESAAGGAVTAELKRRGWHFSRDQVQFRNTVTIDLTQPEDALLAAMGQSTRRKIRIAEREGVTIREGSAADLPLLYALYQTTGQRDNFLIRPLDYYQEAWRRFMAAGLALPLIAEHDGTPLGAVILFHFARTCWYFYGMSANEGRDKQPNYLLQWRAMQWAKARGCATYDMWGAPDVFAESDRLWGVFQFKRGFHGQVRRHIGAWDYAPFPPLYWLYTRVKS